MVSSGFLTEGFVGMGWTRIGAMTLVIGWVALVIVWVALVIVWVTLVPLGDILVVWIWDFTVSERGVWGFGGWKKRHGSWGGDGQSDGGGGGDCEMTVSSTRSVPASECTEPRPGDLLGWCLVGGDW